MHLISFNVNGIRAAAKKGLHESLELLDADVYCFQETKANVAQVAEVLGNNNWHVHANEAEKAGYSGTAIASRTKPINWLTDMGKTEHDTEGRLTGAEFEKFYLVNVYVPNSGGELARLPYRKTWDADLLAYLQNLEKHKPVALCGDLNVAHRPIDIARPEANYNKSPGYTQTEIDGLSAYLSAGFIDSFRFLYPDKVKYSWWSYRAGARAKNIGWRLDYFLLSKSLKTALKDAEIHNSVLGSDHCPVGVKLDF